MGYFVLGPSDLYKLVKEIGKFIQNIRTLGTEASFAFENSMESQLELKEIRKAQRELNEAFSFRRSINVDDDAEVFTKPDTTTTMGPLEEEIGAGVAAAAATAEDSAPPKRKKRRRVKKRPVQPDTAVASTMESSGSSGNIPDLDMSDAFPSMKDERADIPSAEDMAKEDLEWLNSEEPVSSSSTNAPAIEPKDPAQASQEQSRFQQQLSASWNQKVVENEDQLAPLAMIMEKLALLEEEKAAADRRLEDEFRERFQLEEDFYRKKRDLLEESAAQVQQDAYVTIDSKKK